MRVLLAITGASGSIYASYLAKELLPFVERLYLVASESGMQVCRHELSSNSDHDFPLVQCLQGKVPEALRKKIRVFKNNDFFAPVASGSSAPSHMVLLPCSMGSLSRIKNGISSNLIERAADVVLKEKRPLIICPRETPFNTIHLENMLALANMGAQITPLIPAFYQKPKSIEDLVKFMVGRILVNLGIEQNLYPAWNKPMQ